MEPRGYLRKRFWAEKSSRTKSLPRALGWCALGTAGSAETHWLQQRQVGGGGGSVGP